VEVEKERVEAEVEKEGEKAEVVVETGAVGAEAKTEEAEVGVPLLVDQNQNLPSVSVYLVYQHKQEKRT